MSTYKTVEKKINGYKVEIKFGKQYSVSTDPIHYTIKVVVYDGKWIMESFGLYKYGNGDFRAQSSPRDVRGVRTQVQAVKWLNQWATEAIKAHESKKQSAVKKPEPVVVNAEEVKPVKPAVSFNTLNPALADLLN
jgi:hypothetical protein